MTKALTAILVGSRTNAVLGVRDGCSRTRITLGDSIAPIRSRSAFSCASVRAQRKEVKHMKACLIWIAALFLSASGAAQTNRGGISGTVTDKSSAVVPDVTVQITNVGTNETHRVTTSKQGAFSVQNLDPVVYRVEVDVPGFKKAIVEHVKVDTATVETVNLILEQGDQAT